MPRPAVAAALAAALLSPGPAAAGLYLAIEPTRPLPAEWRGFLPDHRLLRAVAAGGPGAPALRADYLAAKAGLDAVAKTRPLTAAEAAEWGGLLVRLGDPGAAVGVLRPARVRFPTDFKLAAHLGTAWHLAGDADSAAAALADGVGLAPPADQPAEALLLKLVRARAASPRSPDLDDLFGVRYGGPGGNPVAAGLAQAERAKLPADAVALVQRLAVCLPGDGRLLWQLGELANAAGDVRAAAAILDGCATGYGLGSPDFVARRRLYRAAADALDRAADPAPPVPGVAFRSTRVLGRGFDPDRLPAVRPGSPTAVPWEAVAATEFGRDGRPRFVKYLTALDGKPVELTGFVAPVGGPGGTDFLFTENPVGCWFCETPGPTQSVVVTLAAGADADPGRALVKLTGVLRLNRADPEGYPVTVAGGAIGPAD